MTINLNPLTERELKLLLAVLQLRTWPPSVPIGPIKKVASQFQAYVKQNRKQFAPLRPEKDRTETLCYPIQWVRDRDRIGLRTNTSKREAQAHVDKLTRQQWRRIKDELRRVLEESHRLAYWGFRLPVMLPSRRAFVDKPETLILDWLMARLIANGQQFRFVARCRYRYCGKAGLRRRARKENLYCSDVCKRKAMVEQRREERAKLRTEKKQEKEAPPLDDRGIVGLLDEKSSRSRVPREPAPTVHRG